MLTRSDLHTFAERLYEVCPYPAVKYKIVTSILDLPPEDERVRELYPQFLKSDIVEEMFETQDKFGGWGRLNSKDYSAKDKIPTSATGIERCLYIGLQYDDRDILFNACAYLEDFLTGHSRENFVTTNERGIPWGRATVCTLLESIRPYNELCDSTYQQWMYIAGRAYETGEYSYEREKNAQHDVFLTREDRLVPMQFGLLLCRRDEVPPEMENAMLRHHGEHAYYHGHFWDNCPAKLPETFVYDKTRRWFKAFNYINSFRGSSLYLAESVDWLLSNVNADGLWDWGTQTKDPWGYFGYFSTTRNYKLNRKVDCTMEILTFLKTYIDRNPETGR